MIRAIAIVLCLLLADLLQGQDGAGLKVSGTVGAEVQLYRYGTFSSVRENLAFRVYGSPTFRAGDWTIPSYFNLGDYQRSYRQAFNKIGVSPQYKDWLTIHLGHRTVKFSDLTLSGHNFLGGGVEVQRNKLRLAAVGGQFLKPIVPDPALGITEYVMPAYRRMGFAVKAGYGTDRDYIDLIFFSAQDQVSSVDVGPDTLGIMPAANSVLGLALRKPIAQRWLLELEMGVSAYTEDVESEEQERKGLYATIMSPFVTGRTSTRYLPAVQSKLGYKVNRQTVSLTYDRISPGYETMGEYFFRDDIERIKLGANLQMAKNKLRLMPALGLERSGLNGVAAIAQARFIGGIRAYYRPSQQLTLFGHYHNFQTRLKQRAFVPRDTVLFTQINTQLQANATYRFTNKRMASGGISITGGKTRNVDSATSTLSQQMIYANYRHPIQSIDLQLTGGVSISRYRLPFFNTTRYQPYVVLRKAFLNDKLDVSYNVGVLFTYVGGTSANTGWRNILNLGFKTFERHRLSARLAWFVNAPAGPLGSFTELQGNIGYRVML